MSSTYWLMYEFGDPDIIGPYRDILRCRELAVTDASESGERVQIHRGETMNDCVWDSDSLVEEW